MNDHFFQYIGLGKEWTVVNAVSPLPHYSATENRRLFTAHQAVPTNNALTAGTEKYVQLK